MESKRLLYIDALRGLAVFLVVWQHATEVFWGYLPNQEVSGALIAKIAHLFDFGRVGVVIFFCISGYVIPFSLKENSSFPLKNFLISRFFRLYPIYWLSIPFGYFATYYLWNKDFSHFDWVANITMLPELLKAQPAMGLYWSLQIEIFFYFLCAFLFYLGQLHRKNIKGVLSILFSIMFFFNIDKYFSLLFGNINFFENFKFTAGFISMMFFGSLVREYGDKKTYAGLAFISLYCIGWLVLFPGKGLFTILKLNEVNRDLISFYISHSLGIFIFLICTTTLPIKSNLMAYLGKISYSMYLFHPFVIFTSVWILLSLMGVSNKLNLHIGLSLLLVLSITLFISSLFHRFIELPAINFGKKIRSL